MEMRTRRASGLSALDLPSWTSASTSSCGPPLHALALQIYDIGEVGGES